MKNKNWTSRAPGNLFLLGEHSVVYNRKALLTSIGKYTKAEANERNDEKIHVKSKGYGEIDTTLKELEKIEYEDHEDYENEMDPIKDLLRKYKQEKGLKTGLNIEISSDIPKESGGMSSSTAVLSSVLKILNKVNEENMMGKEYFKFLLPIQVKIHGGAASGSEIMSSTLGGYNTVRKTDEGVKYENISPEKLHIVIGDTGIEAKTSETVSYVKRGWENHEEPYEEAFDEIEKLVEEGERAIERRNKEKLGKSMNKNQEKLRILGVSHPKLESLISASLNAGALGAKLSGGGKGGIMIALTEEKNQEDVAKAIERKRGRTITTEIGVRGAKTY